MLTQVDIVISSTGSPSFILNKQTAQGVIAARKNRPIFFVDIAVPRDIDPAVNTIDNMFVYDIDDLSQVADANLRQRQKRPIEPSTLSKKKSARWYTALKTHEVAPTIVSLQSELDEMRRTQIERFRPKLGNLDPQQEAAIEGSDAQHRQQDRPSSYYRNEEAGQ